MKTCTRQLRCDIGVPAHFFAKIGVVVQATVALGWFFAKNFPIVFRVHAVGRIGMRPIGQRKHDGCYLRIQRFNARLQGFQTCFEFGRTLVAVNKTTPSFPLDARGVQLLRLLAKRGQIDGAATAGQLFLGLGPMVENETNVQHGSNS